MSVLLTSHTLTPAVLSSVYGQKGGLVRQFTSKQIGSWENEKVEGGSGLHWKTWNADTNPDHIETFDTPLFYPVCR